jgi:putative folate metabolism gamma-glutamate ligase
MIVTPYITDPVVVGDTLFPILEKFLPPLKEKDIVAVTSKIVGICEGNVVKTHSSSEKRELIRTLAQLYIDNELTQRYGFQLTIANNILIPNAGVDESNGNGYLVLWPKNPLKSATEIWNHLKKRNKLTYLGVVITDSHTTILRKGTTGIALSWCGFSPLNNYIGTPDIFGRNLQVTYAHIADGLAASAVTVMGEGNEQTPLAVIKEAQQVQFQRYPPSKEELADMRWPLEEDLYAPLLMNIPWKKGKGT